jgi:hypothetical protein
VETCLNSPFIIPLGAFAMATLIVGVIVWGKTHMKELEIDRDLQLQRMEHERKMKELEIEKLKVSRPEL